MEIGILQAIAALHCPFLTAVMLFFTYIGEWGAACIAMELFTGDLLFQTVRAGRGGDA